MYEKLTVYVECDNYTYIEMIVYIYIELIVYELTVYVEFDSVRGVDSVCGVW